MSAVRGATDARTLDAARARPFGIVAGLALLLAFVLASLPSTAFGAKAPLKPTSVALASSAPSAEYEHENTVVFTANVSSGSEQPSGKGSVLNGKKKVCALVF